MVVVIDWVIGSDDRERGVAPSVRWLWTYSILHSQKRTYIRISSYDYACKSTNTGILRTQTIQRTYAMNAEALLRIIENLKTLLQHFKYLFAYSSSFNLRTLCYSGLGLPVFGPSVNPISDLRWLQLETRRASLCITVQHTTEQRSQQ